MKKKYTSTLREWINTLFWAGLIAIVFRSFLLEPFNIPSGSMIPTLQVGDHLFVKKWSYGYSRYSFPFGSWHIWDGRFLSSDPETGDVIVFRNPDDSVDYVKRLIGQPGDTVQVMGGRLYINGKIVERKNPRPYIMADLPKSLRAVGYHFENITIKGNKIWVDNEPAKFNYTIEYKSDRLCQMAPQECQVYRATEWTEVLPNGREHQIVELSDDRMHDNTQMFRVPDGIYFMMGDDRDRSDDSRVNLGYVPRDYLMGRAWFVWYSHNYYSPLLMVWNWFDKIRWGRFGMGIN